MEEKLPKLPLFVVELCLIIFCWHYLWRAVICLGLWVLIKALGELGLLSCSVSDLMFVSEMPAPTSWEQFTELDLIYFLAPIKLETGTSRYPTVKEQV